MIYSLMNLDYFRPEPFFALGNYIILVYENEIIRRTLLKQYCRAPVWYSPRGTPLYGLHGDVPPRGTPR